MSHYAVIANVIEITMTLPNNDGSIPREKQLLAPGGVALVGPSLLMSSWADTD